MYQSWVPPVSLLRKLQQKSEFILLDSILWCLSVPVWVQLFTGPQKYPASYSTLIVHDVVYCRIYSVFNTVLWLPWEDYIRTVWEKMATLTELNMNRVLNIMSARTSNTKQKKCSWPDYRAGEIRVKNIESVIVEGWKFIQETYLLTLITYLVSQTIAGF